MRLCAFTRVNFMPSLNILRWETLKKKTSKEGAIYIVVRIWFDIIPFKPAETVMSRFERNYVSVWQLVARSSIITNGERPFQTSAPSSTETSATMSTSATITETTTDAIWMSQLQRTMLPQLLFVCCSCGCQHCGVLSIRSGNDTSSSMLIVDFKRWASDLCSFIVWYNEQKSNVPPFLSLGLSFKYLWEDGSKLG